MAPTSHSTRPLTVELVTGNRMPAGLIDSTMALDSAAPFGRAIWWDSWWRHLRPPGSELFLLTVSQGDELLGLAPCYAHRSYRFGRVVRFLGDGHACSDYMTIAAVPDYRVEVWREITKWVAAEAGRSWDTFILAGVSASDEPLQTFCKQISRQNVLVDQRTVSNTWRLTLPDTWDAYVELLSGRHRNQLRRTKREMFNSGRAILRRVTSLSDFERGFDIQRHLYRLRRNSLGDDGCFADPRFEPFLRETSRRFLEQGALRLQWMEVDGEPVAFESSFVDQQGVFGYQFGFDPSKSKLNPGRLHIQASIMKAIVDGYSFFDFLRGDEPYKAHFRATPIPLLETRLIARRTLPRLGHRFWKLQNQLKAGVRASLGRKVSFPTGVPVAKPSQQCVS